jgi:hypothetical protein
VLAGVVSDTGMRAAFSPSRNTMSKRFMTGFQPGTSAGYDLRGESWAPKHAATTPRRSGESTAIESASLPVIRMGEFE